MLSENDKNIAFKTLELDVILRKVAEQTVSLLGKEEVTNLPFLTNKNELEKEIGRVTEMRDLLRFDDPFPLKSFDDMRSQIKRAEFAGAFLQPSELLSLKHFLNIINQLTKYFKERSEKYPLLKKEIDDLIPIPALENEIGRIIDPSGEIKDSASKKLSELRKEIVQKSTRMRQRLEMIFQSLVAKGYVQEENLVLRDGRLVIPLKENQSGSLKGIVVDQSASGATLFVEPIEIIEMGNTVRRLKIHEKQEMERILKELTVCVQEHLSEIKKDFIIAGKIDGITARAIFSLQINGNPGIVGEEDFVELKAARHPILALRSKKEDVVPLSLKIGGNLRTLVITGPNAGGKTVALKTTGLLVLMHQHGFHVPAEEGTVFPVFSNIFADIGDRQSIEQDLSTFSSHVQNIRDILEKANDRSLVLLDEIGSSTDPEEGAALASVILRTLTRRRAITLATTHMGSLKVFAHEEEGVENGSMVFDQRTLRPTYRFHEGVPGSSYAFEISERLGIDKELINEAKELLGEKRGKLDQLILQLEETLQSSQDRSRDVEIEKSKLSGLIVLYQNRLNQLQEESEKKKNKILEKAETILNEANKVIERSVREIKESQANRSVIRQIKQEIRIQKERVKSLSQPKPKSQKEIRPGDWVVWRDHAGKGQVVSGVDRMGRMVVQWGEIKLKVSMSELEKGTSPDKESIHAETTSFQVKNDIGDEIDLRGMTVDEALETLERYLHNASMAGFSLVRIIHGKGTGVLRREVGQHLDHHPIIKSKRLGNWNEGDTGVTIVEII